MYLYLPFLFICALFSLSSSDSSDETSNDETVINTTDIESTTTTTATESPSTHVSSDDTDHYTVEQDFNDAQLITTPPTVPKPLRRRKRQANFLSTNAVDNYPYTMEVLVAADRKMQEYHGSELQAYILTLMSIVSNIFADASIGNSINVAVVHILLLEDDLHVESNNVGTYVNQVNNSIFNRCHIRNAYGVYTMCV